LPLPYKTGFYKEGCKLVGNKPEGIRYKRWYSSPLTMTWVETGRYRGGALLNSSPAKINEFFTNNSTWALKAKKQENVQLMFVIDSHPRIFSFLV